MRQLLKTTFTVFVALVFTAGMAFGQSPGDNSATSTQVGDGHQSTINQTLGFGSAEGHIAQVTQKNGNNNFSDIQQGQAKGRAFVKQAGSRNISRLSQAGFNRAEVTMRGDGNRLGRYSDLSSPARQENGTGLFSDRKNTLLLDVKGNRNQMGIYQDAGNFASVEVNKGNRNRIKLNQDREDLSGGDYSGLKNRSTVFVNGSRNNVDVYQGDGVGANVANVDITGYGGGNSNLVDIDQMSNSNRADVSMTGSNNRSVIQQN